MTYRVTVLSGWGIGSIIDLMSGHSKWSTIKHQKQAADSARGQIFTKLGAAITIAVREGATADPESNFKLRLAIEKARQVNMPKENIERAINRASGKNGVGELEEVVYEGFGPGGVAILVEAVTDNKQRTAALVKNVFNTGNGHMAGSGSVSYLFNKIGLLRIEKNSITSDQMLELVIDSGATDYEEEGNLFTIYTRPADLHKVRLFFENKKNQISEMELTFKPSVEVKITDAETAKKTLHLLHSLNDLDDVHKVITNAIIPDNIVT